MSEANLNFNGLDSSSLGFVPYDEQTLLIPERDITFTEVSGRNGDVATDNHRLKSVPFKLSGDIFPDNGQTIEQAKTTLSNALLADGNYHQLTWSGEPDYVYNALFYAQHEVKRTTDFFASIDLSFTVYPYKFIKSGLTAIAVKQGQKLTNLGKVESEPIITITGSGDCTLSIGSSALSLKSVDGGIIIDTMNQTCTSLDHKRTQFDKMYSDFPKLPKGDSTVGLTSGFTATIVPRWAVIV